VGSECGVVGVSGGVVEVKQVKLMVASEMQPKTSAVARSRLCVRGAGCAIHRLCY
jgi:hypothetical protein